VVDIYKVHKGIVVGLYVESHRNFPLVVGCSIRSPRGIVLDIPARVLKSPGLALWAIDAPAECATQPNVPQASEWRGDIIFALWANFSFTKSLADTGWVHWDAFWLIGSSLASLRAQEEDIGRKYEHGQNVWAEKSEFVQSSSAADKAEEIIDGIGSGVSFMVVYDFAARESNTGNQDVAAELFERVYERLKQPGGSEETKLLSAFAHAL